MELNPRDVVITGLGPVTSIGVGVEALWSALSADRTNVAARPLMVDAGQVPELPVASMPPADQVANLQGHLDFLAGQDCPAYRDLAYAILAVELALTDAGLEYDRQDNAIGVIQAFEAPGVEHTVARLFGMLSAPPPDGGPPQVYECLAPSFYNAQPFMYVHLLGKALGLHGFSTSLHNACSTGAFAVEVAAGHIRSGRADVMIVAGGEAFETGVRLEWFRRLDLYATDGQMKPFDCDSSGFYVGEGGAAIVLESAHHARQRGARMYAAYAGGAFAQQGWKQSIPDMRSARLAAVIEQALETTGTGAADLDLVVPHGAGTPISDGYESTCLERALKGRVTSALATVFKPYVGHQLAGSGVIELVAALLAMHHQAVPATLGSNPEKVRLPIPLVTEFAEHSIDRMLKLSTGFTGHDAAAVFCRVG
ncbi:MAG: beta-ketoacyl synthase N-terminal-like domain-containing protein [Phycisphaerae bacterium]